MSTESDSDVKDELARKRLIELASEFYDQFAEGNVPTMEIPTRTKTKTSGSTAIGPRPVLRTASGAHRSS